MTTPAIEAKEYAAANGFTIEPNGRRYTCTHAASGTTFERGGYAALLNEMRAVIGCIQNGADEIVGNGGAADSQCVESVVDAADTGNDAASDRQTLYVGRGVELDALGKKYGMEPRNDAETDASYRYYLTFGMRMPKVATGAELDKIAEIPPATREEIRISVNRANTIIASKRKPYVASFTYKDGSRVTGRFATYPEAVKYARRRLSGPDGKRIVSQSIVYAG